MRHLEYTKSDFGFEYHMVEFNHYDSFLLRYSHNPICATSGTWQGHYAT